MECSGLPTTLSQKNGFNTVLFPSGSPERSPEADFPRMFGPLEPFINGTGGGALGFGSGGGLGLGGGGAGATGGEGTGFSTVDFSEGPSAFSDTPAPCSDIPPKELPCPSWFKPE